MFRRPLGLLAILVALLASPAAAWWCSGHMLVAGIALQFVKDSTYNKVLDLIGVLAPWYPTSPEFISSACWADDLKDVEDVHLYDLWHYVHMPVVVPPFAMPLPGVQGTDNVIWAISQAVSILNSSTATNLTKAQQLRFLIHFVGDIHQPMHILTLYSKAFPNGDNNGNLYSITYTNHTNITNLHAFYDSSAGLYPTDIPRPLSNNSLAWIDDQVNAITQKFPLKNFIANLTVRAVADWVDQEYSAYYEQVYSPPENSTLTPGYISQAQYICTSQIALGGYRLAQVLDSLFA